MTTNGHIGHDLPDPGSAEAPKYWRYEVSGRLAEAVRLFLLDSEALTETDISWLRAYFRQWINSSVWDLNPYGRGDELQKLRGAVDALTSVSSLREWWREADELGLDPL